VIFCELTDKAVDLALAVVLQKSFEATVEQTELLLALVRS